MMIETSCDCFVRRLLRSVTTKTLTGNIDSSLPPMSEQLDHLIWRNRFCSKHARRKLPNRPSRLVCSIDQDCTSEWRGEGKKPDSADFTNKWAICGVKNRKIAGLAVFPEIAGGGSRKLGMRISLQSAESTLYISVNC